MNNDRILITGGLGFIGREIARQLVEQRRRVRLFDNLSPQIHGAIPDLRSLSLLRCSEVEVVRGDICGTVDWDSVLADVSCVIHLAAETGTAQSMYEISRYTNTNVGGTASLLDRLANHRHGISKVILASSRSVYGEGSYLCAVCGVVYPPMRTAKMLTVSRWEPECPICGKTAAAIATAEDARTVPASIYAATKLAQEDLVRITGKALGIPTVIFRFQNVYGEGQSLKNPYTGILSIFSNQIRLGRPVHLYEDGEESRDFVHVVDVARAVCLAVNEEGGNYRTLNVGSGAPTTVCQIAHMLRDRLGGRTRPEVSGEYRLGDIRHGYADISSIASCLGFAPRVSLETGLDGFVSWVKQQPEEPDLLEVATKQLVTRGLMEDHAKSEATSV